MMTLFSRASPILALFSSVLLSGCATYPNGLSSSGPSEAVIRNQSAATPQIAVVDVTGDVAKRLHEAEKKTSFSAIFGNSAPLDYRVGYGDTLEVSVWEAQPAVLFGLSAASPREGHAGSGATTFPEQTVSRSGTVDVPFAGAIPVVGKSPQTIQDEIARRLLGKANQPRVLVRVTHNVSAHVTVVGDVKQSLRMPLSAGGERLLDAVAAAGGVTQGGENITLQMMRGGTVASLPLDTVIRQPSENVVLQPGDVITAQYRPLSISVLGATGKNDELAFEAKGISLAQALARAGGLADARADAQGVFIFRFEPTGDVEPTGSARPKSDDQGPVIYRMDLKNPVSFLLAQRFPMKDKDVLYVSNAPAAELQKFLNIISSAMFSITGLSAVSH